MHRRIHVAERPLVGRNLSVGMHVPLAQHQDELILGKIRIHQRQRNAVKRQVPCGVPGILPFVGHGDDVGVVQMRPLVIAAVAALRRRRRIARIAFEPLLHHVVIELLGPQHAGKALAHDILRVRRKVLRDDGGVKFVGLAERDAKIWSKPSNAFLRCRSSWSAAGAR